MRPQRRSTSKIKSRVLFGLWLFALMLSLVACKPTGFLKDETPEVATPTSADPEDLPDSAEDLRLILQAIELDDTEAIWAKCHPDAQKKYGKEQIIDRHQKIHESIGISSVRYDNVALISEVPEQAKHIYEADVTCTTVFGTFTRRETLNLIFNAATGRWELGWTPAIIVPGLHEQGTVRIRPLTTERGRILDCNGKALAENGTAYRLGIVPERFDMDRLAEFCDYYDLEIEDVERLLNQSWVNPDTYVPVLTKSEFGDLDYQAARDFNLQIDAIPDRLYPYGESAASLIGYVAEPSAEDLAKPEFADVATGEKIGKAGVEALFDQELRGKNGFQLYVTGATEVILIEEPVIEGKDIQLTIDAEKQKTLYEQLNFASFTAVALDPDDGSIRALITTPSYDPNLFLQGMSQAQYDALLNDPDLPLVNKFNARYVPGSTQKLLTAFAAMEAGTLTLNDKKVIAGKYWQKDEGWGKYKIRRVEPIEMPMDVADALVYSDNIFFAQVALDMGAKKFLNEMHALGVEREFKTAYPFLPSKISTRDLTENEVLLADTAYGQGELELNPLELSAVYAAVLNGNVPEPKLFVDEDFPPRAELKLSKDERKTLKRALRRVVTERYPGAMEREGYKIAGKSGTAELGLDSDDKMIYNSWFVGYDQSNPDIVLTLCLFNAQEHDKTYCHEMFANCLEAWATGRIKLPDKESADETEEETDVEDDN